MTYDFVAFGHAFVVVSLTIYPTNRIKFLQSATLTIIYCSMTRALLITFYALQMTTIISVTIPQIFAKS